MLSPIALVATTSGQRVNVDWTPTVLACAMCGVALIMAACGNSAASACDPLAAFNGSSVIHCPQLGSILVRPENAAVGESVAVSAITTDDLDAGTTMFAWSAPSGTFADPSSPLTTFTCTAPGTVTVTITATREGCTQTSRLSVDCVAREGGGD
jgi:hypothetical protein